MTAIELIKALAMNAIGHEVELPAVAAWRVTAEGSLSARIVIELESGERFELVATEVTE